MFLEVLRRFRNLFSVRSSVVHPFKPRMYDSTKNLFVFFRITGYTMTIRSNALYITYSLTIIFIATILTVLLLILGYFVGEEKMQINQFLTYLQLCITASTGAIQFCVMIYMQPHLFKFPIITDKLDDRIEHPDESREAQRGIRFGNQIVVIFVIIYNGYSILHLVGSVYMGRPPYSFYIPFFNWRDSFRNLVIASVFEYVLTNTAIWQQIINDTYAVVYCGMLLAHLKILILKVQRIGTDPKCTQDDNLKELVLCIQDHKNILELIDIIKPVISATYFVQFMATALCLGAVLVNISISNDKLTLFGSASYASCLVMEIFPLCYLANAFASENERLPEAIFHTNRFDQSKEYRQLCLVFMHHSQQPIVFYAGKMFEVSLNTVVAIIKFSFSVYTVFDKMGFAERFN